MKDIADRIGRDKVHDVVDDFYERVRRHRTLAQPFSIVNDWPGHKAHLAHFWWVTLGGARYSDKPYSVAEKHHLAGFTPALLQDWLALFRETLSAHLAEDDCEEWYARAKHIGRSLELMHEFRNSRRPTPDVNTACR